MAVKKCFVPSCLNNSDENKNKVFILVPLKEEIRMKWCVAVGRQYSKTKNLFCCEDHFNLEFDMLNWVEYKLIGARIFMKEDVVPHHFINSPKPTELSSKSQLSSSSRKRRSKSLEKLGGKVRRKFDFTVPSTSCQETSDYAEASECTPVELYKPAPVKYDEGIESVLGTQVIHHEPTPAPKTMCDKKTQVAIKPKIRSIGIGTTVSVRSHGTNTVQSKEQWAIPKNPSSTQKYMPSSSGSSSLNESSFTVSEFSSASSSFYSYTDDAVYIRKSTNLLIEKSRFYLGLPENTYFIVNTIMKYQNITETNILICLKKIRLYDTNSRLADDFGISKPNISKIIRTNIPVLASAFQKFIYWQNCETIRSLLPIPFRYRYRNVQSIIDCLEIEIEIPSAPEKQAQSWSQYKKCNIVKYLISATPHCFINYISNGFGGRASDKIIVEKCGFLDVLPNGAHVMADRGFKQITSLLSPKKCELIRPPSVTTTEISTREEVKEGKRIAALRIHIERVIRRLREFKMLKMHSCVNHKMLNLLDHIIIIACGIINFQNPIIQ